LPLDSLSNRLQRYSRGSRNTVRKISGTTTEFQRKGLLSSPFLMYSMRKSRGFQAPDLRVSSEIVGEALRTAPGTKKRTGRFVP